MNEKRLDNNPKMYTLSIDLYNSFSPDCCMVHGQARRSPQRWAFSFRGILDLWTHKGENYRGKTDQKKREQTKGGSASAAKREFHDTGRRTPCYCSRLPRNDRRFRRGVPPPCRLTNIAGCRILCDCAARDSLQKTEARNRSVSAPTNGSSALKKRAAERVTQSSANTEEC